MRLVVALTRKELLLLKRSGEFYLGVVLFGIVLAVLSGFAFRYQGITNEVVSQISPGMLWLSSVFVSVIVLNRQIQVEREALPAVMLATGRSASVFLVKALVTAVLLFVIQSLLSALLVLFFPGALSAPVLPLALVLFVASLGISGVGTLLSLVASSSSSRELLLPVILFPLLFTVSAASTTLLRELIQRQSFDYLSFPFVFLWSFAVVVFALGTALFDSLMEG